MERDEIIWNFLIKKYGNPYGVAALMGNLFVESRLNPASVESSKVKKLGMTAGEYVDAVNDGKYTPEKFANDGIGFGLAQWTYHTRKESLYLYIRSNHFGWIDSLDGQLEFLCNELLSYKTVNQAILNAKDIRACSDIIVKQYEKPKNQTEIFLENRAKYGRGYFDKFVQASTLQPIVKKKYVVAVENVNMRVGNGKEYARVASLPKGLCIPYVAETDGWYAGSFNKKVVWLSKDFSKVEER